MENNTITNDKANVININNIANENVFYRKEIWTGTKLQITVMSIAPGGEVGLEIHNDNDQMFGVTYGIASFYAGETKQDVKYIGKANSDRLILIPAGTWHNIINEQNAPLKLYSVYAPPHHPKGTIHKTKFDSDLADY